MGLVFNFTDWKLTTVASKLQQYDNNTQSVQVLGTIPSGYTMYLAVKVHGTEYDDILLSTIDGGVGATLTASMLAYGNTDYQMQVKGINGTSIRYSNKVTVYVPDSISGDAVWPTIPSAFTQAVTQATAAKTAAETAQAAAEAAAASISVDSAMSDSSTHAVQNKVIKAYVDSSHKVFVVTASYDGNYFTNVSATYDQIETAIEAHKAVVLYLTTDEATAFVLPLTGYDPQLHNIIFSAYDTIGYEAGHDGVVVTVNGYDEWELDYIDLADTYATKTECNAKYTLPSGGITASDLASSVTAKLHTVTIDPDEHITKIDSKDFAARYDDELNDINETYATKTLTGSLSDLATTAKTNLVAAINEAAESGGSLPEVTSSDNGKVLKVVSGEWAKADESGGSANAVLYTEQSLTDSQKTQARTNIGAGTSSFDGAYSSLSGKPTIPSKTSELTNDSGFLTSHQSLAAYRTSAAQDVIDNSKVAKGELVYNVKDYGATGDGVTDDTAAINSCITAAGNNSTIYFPAGTYAVHSVSGTYNAISLVNKSNVEVLLADGAKIEELIETIDSDRTINYRTLLVQNCSNISIRGGAIKGELSKHGTDPQSTDDIHGYGIRIQNSSYVTVEGCVLSDYYGDPIMIVEATGETNSHITIRNCRITDSFRNGVSVCGVTDAVIEGCYISGMTGALPKAGIDVEPESGTNANIIIRNCNIQNADYHAVEVVTGTTGAIIEGCILNGETVIENTARDTILRDCELRYLVSAGGNVEGCTIARCTMRTDKTKFVDCVFDPTISDYTASNIYVLQYESSAAAGAVFEHCVFNDNVSSSASAIFFRNDVSSTKNQSTELRHCTFYLNAKGAGSEVLSEHYYLNMDSCTIVANSAAITNQFFTASSSTGTAVVTNCVFDLRACTSASDYSSIVKLNYANLTVMNCSMIFGSTVPAYWQYPYSTNGTGVIKFIGNHIPAFNTVGRFQSTPTTKVLYGNILSSTTDWSGSYDELSNKPDLNGKQATALTATVSIAVADWAGGTTITKSVTGVTATNIVFCDSSDTSVQCTAQAAGTLTFTADSTPTATVTVKVVILP